MDHRELSALLDRFSNWSNTLSCTQDIFLIKSHLKSDEMAVLNVKVSEPVGRRGRYSVATLFRLHPSGIASAVMDVTDLFLER